MGRIRTIKPALARDKGLLQIELELGVPVRYVWAMLPTVCDREGRFVWDISEIQIDIDPYFSMDIGTVLDALITRGYIVRYACGTRRYAWVPTFNKHQVINNRESPSELPGLDEADGEIEDYRTDKHRLTDAWTTRGARVATREVHAQAEGKGREGKGKEGRYGTFIEVGPKIKTGSVCKEIPDSLALDPGPGTTAEIANTKKPRGPIITNDDVEDVIRTVNQFTTGRIFKPYNPNGKPTKTFDLVKGLLKHGYSVTDLKQVYIRMATKWRDNERMAPYVRPSTIFRLSKFETYVAELFAAREANTQQSARSADDGNKEDHREDIDPDTDIPW